MKRLIPFWVMLAIWSESGCEESQGIMSDSEGVWNTAFSVVVENETVASIVLGDMDKQVRLINAEGEMQPGIPMSELIRASKVNGGADLDDFLAQYICDYESANDGFRPSSKGERCPMVSCLYTKQSYINVMSGRLFYDDDTPMTNGCYHVQGVHKVMMYKANQTAKWMWLYLNGEIVGRQVDIDLLNKMDINGKLAVRWRDVLEAADIHIEMSQYVCEFRREGAEKTMTEEGMCDRVSCEVLQNAFIYLDNRALEENGVTSVCGEITNIQAIYMTEKLDHFESHIIQITYQGKTFDIDIATLGQQAVFVNAVPSIKLTDIVEAAGINLNDPDQFLCDYEGEDGYRPKDRDKCSEVLSCERLNSTFVSLTESHKMKMDDAPSSCYNVSWLSKIEIMPR